MTCRLCDPGMSLKSTWSPVSRPRTRRSGSISNLRSASLASRRTSSALDRLRNSEISNMRSVHRKSAGPRNRKLGGSASRRRLSRQSPPDAAYEAIKHRIITCKFKPGECITQASVSALLCLSRTPIHQAIDRLMLEEMVEVIPRKGVIVKPVILQDVMQMIDVRLTNEVYCAGLAASRADDTHIENLLGIIDRARKAITARDVHALMTLDREF